jgi:MFS transporter, LPLT family, lysophospholipid transporter
MRLSSPPRTTGCPGPRCERQGALSPPSLTPTGRRGLWLVLASQFLSTFADNAVLFLAIALLKTGGSPSFHIPYLQESFVAAFIILAPFVGPFADAWQKGHVLTFGSALKLLGALLLFAHGNPFLSYGTIGIGAAIVSPAKSGILGELCAPAWLVKANSWLEASTVIALLAGAVLGARYADHYAHFCVLLLCIVYFCATLLTLAIPPLRPTRPKTLRIGPLFFAFWPTVMRLLRDPGARLSLLGTALFWGAAAVLRFLLIAWLPDVLGVRDLATAGYLTASSALGVAIGAVIAGQVVPIEKVFRVIPAGLLMGALVASFALINGITIAVMALISIGVLGGFFIVPLNALLQRRGNQLIGAGGAIAVQNLVDNGGMLILVGIYLSATENGLTPRAAAAVVGVTMVLLTLLLLTQGRLVAGRKDGA